MLYLVTMYSSHVYSLSAAQTSASSTAYPGYEAVICSRTSVFMAQQASGGNTTSVNKPVMGKPGT